MKSLIIGAHGMVGLALSKEVPNATKLVHSEPNPRRFELYADITNYESLFDVFSATRPEITYLCAGNAFVDACEDRKSDSVNIRGTLNVVRLCEQFHSRLIFFSSSYVFDGTKESPYDAEDQTNPINHYGQQKVQIEEVLAQLDLSSLVVRTVGVFGPEEVRRNFVHRVADTVTTGRKVHVPDDQKMNPIASWDLARASVEHARLGTEGIIHIAGPQQMTKYEWALIVADYFGARQLVLPTNSKNMQGAPRPKMGCLACSNRAASARSSTIRILDSETPP